MPLLDPYTYVRLQAWSDKEGRNGPKLDRARELLAEAAQRVCNAPGASALAWATPKDRGVADRVKIDILDALSELQKAGK